MIFRSLIDDLNPEALTLGVLAKLYETGDLSAIDIVQIECTRSSKDIALSETEERLSVLLSDELEEASFILDQQVKSGPITPNERELILLVRLMALRAKWDDLTAPQFYVEDELDDWDELNAFADLRFFAPQNGERGRMETYVRRLDERIAERLNALSAVGPRNGM